MFSKVTRLYHRLPRFVRNKFTLSFAGFLLWMLFFDGHSILRRAHDIGQLRAARSQMTYYKSQIAQAQQELDQLFSTNENMERFARERFFLKRDDEQVFLIAE